MDALIQALLQSPLSLFLIGSVLLYAVAENAYHWLPRARPEILRPLSIALSIAQPIGSLLFYLAIPYLALGGWPRRPLQGLLSPADLGLVGPGAAWPATRWLEALSTSLGIGLLTFLVLFGAWKGALQSAGERRSFPARPVWRLLIEGLYLEVHWAFYRGAVAVLLDDVYLGVFFGLALVYVEWSLNPAWRAGWRDRAQAVRWLRTGLALASALLFLLTRNLWGCLLMHWLVEMAFWRVFRDPRPAVPDQTTGSPQA